MSDDVYTDRSIRSLHALHRSDQAFTPTLNASIDLNYELTRDISLKFGAQVAFYLGQCKPCKHQSRMLDNPNANLENFAVGPASSEIHLHSFHRR